MHIELDAWQQHYKLRPKYGVKNPKSQKMTNTQFPDTTFKQFKKSKNPKFLGIPLGEPRMPPTLPSMVHALLGLTGALAIAGANYKQKMGSAKIPKMPHNLIT